jgi:hypothetical protein
MSEELQRYLGEIDSQLSVEPVAEKEIRREIRVHLEDSAAELQEGGLGREESLAQAISNFGEAREVGRMLGLLHSDSANQAVLAAFLPVALALTFKWILLPLLGSLGHWQGSPTPFVFASLAILALLVPGLTLRKWRYGYGVWAFFSLVTIAQM